MTAKQLWIIDKIDEAIEQNREWLKTNPDDELLRGEIRGLQRAKGKIFAANKAKFNVDEVKT